jgi:hypothetical protein
VKQFVRTEAEAVLTGNPRSGTASELRTPMVPGALGVMLAGGTGGDGGGGGDTAAQTLSTIP